MTTLTDEQIEAIRKRVNEPLSESRKNDWDLWMEARTDRVALLADRDHWKKRAEEAEDVIRSSWAQKDGNFVTCAYCEGSLPLTQHALSSEFPHAADCFTQHLPEPK